MIGVTTSESACKANIAVHSSALNKLTTDLLVFAADSHTLALFEIKLHFAIKYMKNNIDNFRKPINNESDECHSKSSDLVA